MKQLRLNDPVKLKISELNDWVYEGEDGLVGAFTLKAIQEIEAGQ